MNTIENLAYIHLDESLQVSVTLGEVDGTELSRPLAVLVVGLEDSSRSLTLDADSTSHLTLQREFKCDESSKN